MLVDMNLYESQCVSRIISRFTLTAKYNGTINLQRYQVTVRIDARLHKNKLFCLMHI